mmetsp:Transcript_27338/g.57501  ORF Transcript_27338/g.57501 Transcript_27338/m.57501 type:complete len:216 (+) Transcript_27338:217-864(+)
MTQRTAWNTVHTARGPYMHVLIHSSSACDAFVFVRVLTSYFRSTDCGDHASIRVHILQIRAFRILDMRHVEAMRRSRWRALSRIGRAQHVPHLLQRPLAEADLNQRRRDVAHLVVEKRARTQAQSNPARAFEVKLCQGRRRVLDDSQLEQVPHGTLCAAAHRAERREVVLADEKCRSVAHRIQVQRLGEPQRAMRVVRGHLVVSASRERQFQRIR